MSSRPLVSVIIPTRNRSALVLRALDSVFRQTFTDYEIIVVDDASTDGTGELLATRHPHSVTVIKKASPEGPGAARNTGIAASKGVYIAFLDDDDEWLPQKLHLQVQLMQQDSSIGLAYCGFVQIGEAGNALREVLPEKRGSVFQDLLSKNYITGSDSTVVMQRSLLDALGGFDPAFYTCEDWDLWIRAARSSRVDFIAAPLVKIYNHAGNLHKNMGQMERDTFALLDKYAADLTEKGTLELLFDRCVYWAWMYYNAGCHSDFSRMLLRAIELFPLSDRIVSYDCNLPDKEKAFWDVFRAYWEQPARLLSQELRDRSYARHWGLFAWVYYERGDLRSFRRCVRGYVAHSYLKDSRGLLFWFCISFLGKTVSDMVHVVHEKIRQESSSAYS